VVIEHNLDVIKTADWIIDLGPMAANTRPRGGRGHSEQVSRSKKSYTAEALRKVLGNGRRHEQILQAPARFCGPQDRPLKERGGKVKTADFASVFRAGSGVAAGSIRCRAFWRAIRFAR